MTECVHTTCNTPDAEVLRLEGAMQTVELIFRTMSATSHAAIFSDDTVTAKVIGDVSADWVCRLLGDVCVVNITHSTSVDQTEAADLIVTVVIL